MKSNKYQKIAIISALNNKIASQKKAKLIKKYDFVDLENSKINIKEIDLILVLGGDGMMLHLLHKYEKLNIPFYGINCGNVGFLMNSPDENNLIKVIEKAEISVIHPLKMTAIDKNDNKHVKIAINEVSLSRQTSQAAHIKIKVNNKIRLDNLCGDGVLLSTPAGSTAYNMSLRGPILPLNSNILALTPISPFRPRNWHGAIIPESSEIEFIVLNHEKRQVSATADFIEVKNIKKVKIKEDKNISFQLMFDADHSLEERIIREQFLNQ